MNNYLLPVFVLILLLTPVLSGQDIEPVPGDTLIVTRAQVHDFSINKEQLVRAGVTVALGLTTYYFYQQAETHYENYLSSGSIDEMDELYRKAEVYDTCTAVSFAGTQVSLLLLVRSFLGRNAK